MGKRITFTAIEQIRDYAQKRFPAERAFSKMSASEKSYANVYTMALADTSLDALKRNLEESRPQSATREKIYQFVADRIEDPHTLAAIKQELAHILEQLNAMTPLAPSNESMDDSEHEEWMRRHTEIGLLVDSATNLALWLVPKEVRAMLKRIDERCIALYPQDAMLTSEANEFYDQAKSDEL